MTALPGVISRYYANAASGELDALLDCFSADAHVRDEGRDHDGLEAIRRWREGASSGSC